jgi:hypothetical protein
MLSRRNGFLVSACAFRVGIIIYIFLSGFKQRLSRKLEDLGNAALRAQRDDDAISEYSLALSLDPTSPQDLLIKRSKAYVAKGLWENGLKDADQVRLFL